MISPTAVHTPKRVIHVSVCVFLQLIRRTALFQLSLWVVHCVNTVHATACLLFSHKCLMFDRSSAIVLWADFPSKTTMGWGGWRQSLGVGGNCVMKYNYCVVCLLFMTFHPCFKTASTRHVCMTCLYCRLAPDVWSAGDHLVSVTVLPECLT